MMLLFHNTTVKCGRSIKPIITTMNTSSRLRPLRQVRSLRTQAFSLVEMLATVALIAILAAIVIPNVGSVRTATAQAKLVSDVAVLNRAVKLYIAEGGSLDGITSAQGVIDRLKTKLSNDAARRHVGPVTGSLVDARLAARTMSDADAKSSDARAVWDATNKKFVLSTTGGGVSEFFLDDGKADAGQTVETRTASTLLYNGEKGWVWSSNGSSGGPSALSPVDVDVGSSGTPYVPTGDTAGSGTSTPSGGGSSTPPSSEQLKRLPVPAITPGGGVYSAAKFPSTVTVSNGGADPSVSVLQYRIDGGAWQNYVGGFSVKPGSQVSARNVSLDPDRFLDSAEDAEIFLKSVDLFTGTIIPKWTNMIGKQNLVKTIDNSTVTDIKATYGKASNSSNSPNKLDFLRIGFISIAPDTDFKIGDVKYYNGTIVSGTEASSVDLDLNLLLTLPIVKSGTGKARISLWSSPNTSNPKESADYIQLDNPVTDFVVEVGGVTYTLKLRFANVSAVEGWTDGTKLFVYENSTGKADLIARFESSY